MIKNLFNKEILKTITAETSKGNNVFIIAYRTMKREEKEIKIDAENLNEAFLKIDSIINEQYFVFEIWAKNDGKFELLWGIK